TSIRAAFRRRGRTVRRGSEVRRSRSRRARSRSCGRGRVTRLTSFRNRGSTSLTLPWACRLSLMWCSRARGALQCLQQGIGVPGVVVTHAVDVEGRRPVHAASHAAHEVLADPLGVGLVGHLLVEQLDVEPELLGVRMEVLVAKMLLVLVKQVMH